MMFAQGLLDFGWTETVLHIVRIIAAVGGAIVGWFACDPLTRLTYRLSFKGATPGSLLLVTKFTGAATLALLIYFFLPLGGGGGFGWGPGQGGGPGKGQGASGAEVASDTTSKNGKTAPKKKTDANPKTLERIEIVIISLHAFKKGGNDFYLLNGAKPALSLSQLEDYFKTHQKIEVTPVQTADSIEDVPGGTPLGDLLDLTNQYGIKTLQTKRP